MAGSGIVRTRPRNHAWDHCGETSAYKTTQRPLLYPCLNEWDVLMWSIRLCNSLGEASPYKVTWLHRLIYVLLIWVLTVWDNGLWPIRRQAIICTSHNLSLITIPGVTSISKLSEFINQFSLTKLQLKLSSEILPPFCLREYEWRNDTWFVFVH